MQRDAAAMATAREQHGCLTREQATALGFTSRMLDARLASGVWTTVLPGVYRLAGAPPSWEGRAMAVSLWLGDEGALTGRTALTLYGCEQFRALAVLDAIKTSRKRSPRADINLISTTDLGPVRTIAGIRVTAPERALMDTAAVIDRRLLERVLARAMALRVTDRGSLIAYCSGRGKGSRGLASLRWAVERATEKGRSESDLEARCLQVIRDAGLPRPDRQFLVRSNGRRIGRIDLAYPDARIGIEVDGWRWHADRISFHADRARLNSLTAAGWQMLLYTSRTDRRAFVGQLRRMLAGRPLALEGP